MGKIGQNGVTNKENKMNPIQQNVISEVVEKLDASNSLEIPEPFLLLARMLFLLVLQKQICAIL